MIGAILMPYLNFIPSASAQYSAGGSGYSTGGGTAGQGVGYYMQLAGPMIPKLQGCGQVLKNGIGAGINAIKNLFTATDVTGNGGTTSDLQSIWGDTNSAVSSISVNSATENSKLGFIQSATVGAKKIADVTAANKLCLDSVGKMIAKMLIKALTDSTIAWINTGNFGESFWPKDRQHFFEDIAKNEILKFNSEINNPALYPFARAFMQNQMLTLKNHFAQNAQYSLNQMIKNTTPEYTSATFTADFSSGGWNAWNALTQVPANNPIGFNITASNELQSRLAGTNQTTAQDVRDTLKEAGGFLGQEQCASNKSITRESERQALIEGNPYLVPGTSDYDSWNHDHICQKWEYVTPGKMIAEASTKLMNDQKDQLLSINDLNGAIAAILDAAINKYGGDLMNQGLASLIPVDPNNQFDTTDPTGNGGRTQVEQDFTNVQGSSNWLIANSNFNIRTDITQALIDGQRTYVNKMTSYNSALSGLILNIHQLDYCIPGPHPGWENDSRTALDTILGNLTTADDTTAQAISTNSVTVGAALGAAVGSIVPGVGTVIGAAVGAAAGAVTSYIANLSGANHIEKYYAGLIGILTGLHVTPDGWTETLQQVNNVMNSIFNNYVTLIHQIYSNPHMPGVTKEAATEFNKIPGYQQIIDNNNNEIILKKSIIDRLGALKQKIDALNTHLASGQITPEQYDSNFTPTSPNITEFSRLSRDMVSGSDIANVDNLSQQATGEKDYVYKDLLKGPFGCEQDLSNGDAVHLPWQIFNTERMPYPFPLLYDYNNFASGAALPSVDGAPITHMHGGAVNNVGPGFLSYVKYVDTHVANAADDIGSLDASNLLNLDKWAVSVGQLSHNPSSCENDAWTCAGTFEKIIGIY